MSSPLVNQIPVDNTNFAVMDLFADGSDIDDNYVEKTSWSYSTNILASLMELRCDGNFCDVTLKSGKFTVKAHKLILASATDYFKAMFMNEMAEAESGTVDFSKMLPEVVEQCIQFIYSGKLKISMKIARELLDASEMMQLPELSKLCVEFLADKVDLKTCADVIRLSNLYNKDSLNQSLTEFLQKNFAVFIKSDEFTTMDFNSLMYCIKLLSENDALMVFEELKWTSILTWTNEDLEGRSGHFPELFKLLDLGFISKNVLRNDICTNGLVDNSVECLRLIRDVLVTEEDETAPLPLFVPKETSHIVSYNKANGLVAGCSVTCMQATSAVFPLALNVDMDVVYHQHNIYIGTGLKIYEFSNGNWSNKNVNFNIVKRNPCCITCPLCYKDHWYLGEKAVTQEVVVTRPSQNSWPTSMTTLWTTRAQGIKLPQISTTQTCCNKVIEKTNFSVSCYNRCVAVGKFIYMLTMHYVIEYKIATSKIAHHNVIIGLGNGFSVAASNRFVYAMGGNGTGRKAVAFDPNTKLITQLPCMTVERSFGRAVFKGGKLYVVGRTGDDAEECNLRNREWSQSSIRILHSSESLFGDNLHMLMAWNNPPTA